MHVAGEILLELFCCMPGLLDGAEFGRLSDVWSVSQNFCFCSSRTALPVTTPG